MSILNSLPTKIGMATETSNGLMSSDDKKLVNKINRIESDVADKMNKTDKIRSSQLDTSSNFVKIQPNNLSDEVKAMMTGSTPVAPQLQYKSLVTEYFADNSVTSSKRTANGSIAIIVSDEFCDFDTTGDTDVVLSIPKNYNIYFGPFVNTVVNTPEYIHLTKDEPSVIVYNKTHGISARLSTAVEEDDYIIGAFDGKYVTMFNGRYTVNRSVVVGDQSLDGSAIKDFSIDSKKLAIQHGTILGIESESPYLNANFTSNFIEVLSPFSISVADQFNINIKSRQQCAIPKNVNNKDYLYIYYDLGIKTLSSVWASTDISNSILNNNDKLVLIGIIYNKEIAVGINKEFISVNSISLIKREVEYANIFHGLITIDFANKKIIGKKVDSLIDNNLYSLTNNTTQTINLTDNIISDIISSNIPYTLGAVKTDFNSDDFNLVFKPTSEIKSLGLNAIALATIDGDYNISHNKGNIIIIKKDGNIISRSSTMPIGNTLPMDDQSIVVKLNTEIIDGVLLYHAELQSGTTIVDLSNNNRYEINTNIARSMNIEDLHGVYSILFNTKVYGIELLPLNTIINNEVYISLGAIQGINDSLSYTCMGNITNHITLNNNRPSNYQIISGPDPDKGYDWSNNRLVIPDDIYLLTNSQYSLYCQNMSMNKYIDNDYIMYEIGLPTSSILTENIMNINSPVSGEFETRIVGKFKGNNNCLFKDINLHFEKPEGKKLSILCIGDDTVDMNMPGYINDYLSQLGYIPTMLGTQINSIDINGYGMKNLESEVGEGHKGWRLTDFMCRTKHKDGSPYYIPNNPFMNNSKFDFEYYMTSNSYDKVDVVVLSMGLNDITNYHTASAIEDIENLTISQNIERLPNLYKEMISNIHSYDSNIKIIINPTMIKGINDDFNRKSLLLTETLIYDLKNINNVFFAPGYLTQPLFVAANKNSTQSYESYNDINDTKIGSSVSSFDINGVAQSNLAYTIVSAIVGVTK